MRGAWLVDLYGATNAEEVADMEILLALGAALVIMVLVTFPCKYLWKKYRQAT